MREEEDYLDWPIKKCSPSEMSLPAHNVLNLRTDGLALGLLIYDRTFPATKPPPSKCHVSQNPRDHQVCSNKFKLHDIQYEHINSGFP
jgi:hypothetical protein